MKKKVRLKELAPIGDKIEGTIVELDSEKRYIIMLDDTLSNEQLEHVMKKLGQVLDEVFGDGVKRFIYTTHSLGSIYELEVDDE